MRSETQRNEFQSFAVRIMKDVWKRLVRIGETATR